MENEYGKTDNLMEKEIFMAMNRGLSASPHLNHDQHDFNSSYDFMRTELGILRNVWCNSRGRPRRLNERSEDERSGSTQNRKLDFK